MTYHHIQSSPEVMWPECTYPGASLYEHFFMSRYSQVLLFEPHRERRNEFVYIPSHVAIHDELGEADAVREMCNIWVVFLDVHLWCVWLCDVWFVCLCVGVAVCVWDVDGISALCTLSSIMVVTSTQSVLASHTALLQCLGVLKIVVCVMFVLSSSI